MATPIPTDPSNTVYYFNFATGNTSHGVATPFTAYASNHDTNYRLLRDKVNELIVEVNATSSQNNAFIMDHLFMDDADAAAGTSNTGVIGESSLRVTIDTDTTKVLVEAGPYAIEGNRLSLNADTLLVGSGGSGTKYINVDNAGNLTIQDTASVLTTNMDLASLTWNGSIWTGAVTLLPEVFQDGDSYREMRWRTGHSSWPTTLYRSAADRIFAIEEVLEGITTTMSDISLGFADGLVGTPSIFFADDSNTGIYSPADGKVALTTNGVQKLTATGTGVGINEGSPVVPLHVTGLSGETVVIIESPESEACLLQWQGDLTGTEYFAGRIDQGDEDRFSIGRRFIAEDMVLLNDGSIGMGVVPTWDFDVDGNTLIRGAGAPYDPTPGTGSTGLYLQRDSGNVVYIDAYGSAATTELSLGTSSAGTLAEAVRINSAGNTKFVGSVGFNDTAPVAQPTGYTTFTNLVTDRTCDANATTVEELADILGTLIVDLKATGIIAT